MIRARFGIASRSCSSRSLSSVLLKPSRSSMYTRSGLFSLSESKTSSITRPPFPPLVTLPPTPPPPPTRPPPHPPKQKPARDRRWGRGGGGGARNKRGGRGGAGD